MSCHQQTLHVSTPGRGLHEITDLLRAAVAESGIGTGLCVVFCTHTSCSLMIQENADPSARADLEAWLDRLAPDGDPRNVHVAEGPDDSPAHMRAAVTRTSETIPVVDGELALGAWQGVYLAEHRLAPHQPRLVVTVQG